MTKQEQEVIDSLEYRVYGSALYQVKQYHRDAAVAKWRLTLQSSLREWPTWPNGDPKDLVAEVKGIDKGEVILVPGWR